MNGPRTWTTAALALLAGCATLEPPLPEAQPNVAPAWVLPETSADAPAMPLSAVPDVGWRDFLIDERLETLVARALHSNRDLRTAILNVERVRALYRIERAQRLPSVGGVLEGTRTGGDGPDTDIYSAGVGIAAFELDLFGRVRSLSEAALRLYFASEQARRAAELALIAEVANAYLTLAADRELLSVAQATLDNLATSYDLTRKRFELGAVSRLDLAQARTLLENARADAARFEGQVARDINALTLLVGGPLEAQALPAGFGDTVMGFAPLPGGLASELLLRRPDIREAEERLRAANANIGAARAAFFPTITLTGSVGTVSSALSGLFSGGSFAWSFLPRMDVPIFQGGRLQANLAATQAERDIALAQYERSIQAGFREVADAIALSDTLARQVKAQQAQLEAATQAHDLSRARYEAGRDSYLVLLDAQRTLYAARQALIATRLAEQANRVTLYKVLGGGWRDRG